MGFQGKLITYCSVAKELSVILSNRSGILNIIIVHNDLVNERLRHIEFFKKSTMKNLATMMRKIDETISIQEHTQAQTALQKGKETILGKDIDTAIQINNTQQANGDFKNLSDDELDMVQSLLQKAAG